MSAPEPDASTPPASPARSARPWGPALLAVAAVCALVAATLVYASVRRASAIRLPAAHSSQLSVRPSPNVLLAVRDLARLETAAYHMERAVELTDDQTRLFGLIEARDAILLVAVGDVVAGVDLASLRDGDVSMNWPARRVRISLPAPTVFSATLDNARTHVFSRTTDRLARRREDLEGRARQEAEAGMRSAAIEQGILTRARAQGERAVRSLLHSLGFVTVEIVWTEASERTLSHAPPEQGSAPAGTLPPTAR